MDTSFSRASQFFYTEGNEKMSKQPKIFPILRTNKHTKIGCKYRELKEPTNKGRAMGAHRPLQKNLRNSLQELLIPKGKYVLSAMDRHRDKENKWRDTQVSRWEDLHCEEVGSLQISYIKKKMNQKWFLNNSASLLKFHCKDKISMNNYMKAL